MLSFLKKVREIQRPYCTALVAAAGSSSRMGGVNKLMEPLGGIPVLARTLQALERAVWVDAIVIATREEDLLPVSQLCRIYEIGKCQKVICGGENRMLSVMKAALEADPRTELLAVQDGARPLVPPEMIDDVISQASRCGAAAPAIPVKDTVKVIQKDRAVVSTPDRETLMAVQTPQVFEADLLKAALQSAIDLRISLTDDCAAVERLGKTVYLTEGSEFNLKITTPVDLIVAEALLRAREEGL